MPAPRPGKPVRGSRSGRPIMALLDLLGRRWTLRIVWELRLGPLTFRELRARCEDMSPSVLNDRLGELRKTDIVCGGEDGYSLTTEGARLIEDLAPLQRWADRWDKRRK